MRKYNGYLLPNPPEYDVNAYPYACVQYIEDSGLFHFRYGAEPFYKDVAYAITYNGVELSDIDEAWTNKSTYQYALIGKSLSEETYILYLGDAPFLGKTRGDQPGGKAPCTYDTYLLEPESNVWQFKRTTTLTGSQMSSFNVAPIWTSHDLYTAGSLTVDSYLYMQATEPVSTSQPIITTTSESYDCGYTDVVTTTTWADPITIEANTLELEPNTVIWCYVDILDESGAVFLKASDPQKPFSDDQLRSWITGVVVGMAAKRMPLSNNTSYEPPKSNMLEVSE